MKKVEIAKSESEISQGEKVTFIIKKRWRFSEEERQQIRDIFVLRKMRPKGNVEHFIFSLEFYIDEKKLLKNPKQSKLRLTRERVLTNCRAALGDLKQIDSMELILWTHKKIIKSYEWETGFVPPISSFQDEEMRTARETVGPLEKFIKLLEAHHRAEEKKRGRGKGDNDGFVKKLADSYAKYIGKPSTYKEGPFYEVVRTVLKTIKQPGAEYPEETIHNALFLH